MGLKLDLKVLRDRGKASGSREHRAWWGGATVEVGHFEEGGKLRRGGGRVRCGTLKHYGVWLLPIIDTKSKA